MFLKNALLNRIYENKYPKTLADVNINFYLWIQINTTKKHD